MGQKSLEIAKSRPSATLFWFCSSKKLVKSTKIKRLTIWPISDRIRVYEQQKGVQYMSKVKSWAYDEAEKAVDNIVAKLKDGQIDLTEATSLTMKVENVNMLGIDENNVEEALCQ